MATSRDRASSRDNAALVPSPSSGPAMQKRKQPGCEDEVIVVESPQAKKSKVTSASSTLPSKISHWYYLAKIKETNEYTIALESWDGHLKKPKFKGTWAHQSFASLSPQSQRERLELVHLFRLSTAQWDRKYFLCIPPERRPHYLPFDPLDASGVLLKAIVSLVSKKYDGYPSTRSRREQPITWAEHEQAAKAAAEKDLPARSSQENPQAPISPASGDGALPSAPAQASVAPDNAQPPAMVVNIGSTSQEEPTSASSAVEKQGSPQEPAPAASEGNKRPPFTQDKATVTSDNVPPPTIAVDTSGASQKASISAPSAQEKQPSPLLTPMSPVENVPKTPINRSPVTVQMQVDIFKAQRAALKVKKENARAKQVEMQAKQAEMSAEQEDMELLRQQRELELELHTQQEGPQETAGDA